jgi:DNA-directed RNA polymerase subunit F
MTQNEISETRLTLPQVKKVLESIGEENLDQFQRRTLDYVSKFTKIEPAKAEELVAMLVKEYELDEVEAVKSLIACPKLLTNYVYFLPVDEKL